MRLWKFSLLSLYLLCSTLQADPLTAPAKLRCVVPAKPGGGMDLTCQLIRNSLQQIDQSETQIQYLPGGVGAVAWTSVLTQQKTANNTLVAFSGGSLLNIAEGKFGRADIKQVRWLAALGADYGMIAVKHDSPYHSLKELLQALKKNPEHLSIAAGGTVGSQDWIKMAYLAQLAGIDSRNLKIVAFEGGGESFTALQANHVQIVSGDISEARWHAQHGKIRVLAVLADQRLPGVMHDIPTAKEQGYALSWPVIRGVYMPPQISDAEYAFWLSQFERYLHHPAYAQLREKYGLFPFTLTGPALQDYLSKTMDNYRQQAQQLGLIR